MMRAFTALLSCMVVASSASAIELKYKWKKGNTYRFAATSKDVVGMSGMGMNINNTFTTTSTFALKIDRVRGGVAQGTLLIESFEVKGQSGNVVAGIGSIPKGALKNLVEIDAKGRFTFKEVIYLVVDEESGKSILVSGKAGPHSASASGQVGDEQVSVYAEFDPKTGKLSSGYTVKKLKKKKKKKIAVQQDKPKVDILPTQFLQLLRLPDGDVSAGGASFDSSVGSAKISVAIEELTDDSARLRTKVKTEMDTGAVERAAGSDDDDMDAMGMGGDVPPMPGIPGMGPGAGVPGMGAGVPTAPGGGGGGGSAQMQTSGDFVMDFDIKKGMIKGLSGKLGSKMTVGGAMQVNTDSTLEMAAL